MAGRGRDASIRARIVCSRLATFDDDGPVARVVLRRQAVLAEGRFELIAIFELLCALEMRPGRGDHRALQRDRVVRVLGSACTALRYAATASSRLPACDAFSPCRNALPAAHPLARMPKARRIPTALNRLVTSVLKSAIRNAAICNLQSAICNCSRSGEANRLPPAAVQIGHLNRLHTDLHDAILPRHDVALPAVKRTSRSNRRAPRSLRLRRLDDSDELERNRWRRRWPSGHARDIPHDRRRRRRPRRRRGRRCRFEPEQIAFPRDRLSAVRRRAREDARRARSPEPPGHGLISPSWLFR